MNHQCKQLNTGLTSRRNKDEDATYMLHVAWHSKIPGLSNNTTGRKSSGSNQIKWIALSRGHYRVWRQISWRAIKLSTVSMQTIACHLILIFNRSCFTSFRQGWKLAECTWVHVGSSSKLDWGWENLPTRFSYLPWLQFQLQNSSSSFLVRTNLILPVSMWTVGRP